MNAPKPLVKLDYDPNTLVLFVELPDLTEDFYTEVQLKLSNIIDKIRNTNARYLLSDSRKTNVDISEHKFKAFGLEFMNSLAHTRIEKVARIVTDASCREQLVNEVTQKTDIRIPVRSFQSKEEALQWLTSNESL